ncbi:DUF3972 domain-containing protein [Hydrogenimonas thermophila]|uniref:DUF3972 domain-containing protein n=1 Tax=Hydrogenimonas thermophila TaxID=223786 RepID=UPI0029371537|nr:DUF3972 domain-containing protein [Hydrogenimonas thermophila]WOE69964.1 DUF3972 domain-containing protein [Hydrogenimonas thermophila]WOE72481.1 DUF3972 domain-containing protein [Hydrogenimonas thermophila]
MQQLIKPSEYAQMHGLSRQSVYAKIKRGTLPARKIDGRYYVIVATDIESETDEPEEKTVNDKEKIEHVSLIDEYREIIKAKDETIEVLKNSIEDLKEANKQITKTLQEEIALLKQAFHEMRAIYLTNYQITHQTETETTIDIETEEESTEKSIKKDNSEIKTETKNDHDTEDCWIPLGDLIQRQQYNYNKAKQVVKRFKKAYKRGDKRIKKQNGIYFISCYDFYEDILE